MHDLRAALLAMLLSGPVVLGCGSGTSGSATEEGSTGGSDNTGDNPTGGSADTDTGSATGSVATGNTDTGNTDTGNTTTGGSANCAPILSQTALETGFEACDDGSKHRYAALVCPTEKTTDMNPCAPAPDPAACTADADCTQEPLGYCAQAHMLNGYCGCYYGCHDDADCAANELCECGVVVGHCVPATCTVNADCGPGLGCVATYDGEAGPACTNVDLSVAASFACQTAADECLGDLECPADGINDGACLFDGDHRVCGTVCANPP